MVGIAAAAGLDLVLGLLAGTSGLYWRRRRRRAPRMEFGVMGFVVVLQGVAARGDGDDTADGGFQLDAVTVMSANLIESIRRHGGKMPPILRRCQLPRNLSGVDTNEPLVQLNDRHRRTKKSGESGE